jgi:hypothetical protein
MGLVQWEGREQVYDDFITYGFNSKPALLHSLIVSAYSFFENYLFQVARWLESYPIDKKRLNEMWGIKHYRKYFKKYHHFKTAEKTNTHWKKIELFEEIRNLIVHHKNRFNMDESNQMLILFLEGYEVHKPRNFYFKILDRKFLADFVKELLEYANELVAEIYDMP